MSLTVTSIYMIQIQKKLRLKNKKNLLRIQMKEVHEFLIGQQGILNHQAG